MQLNILADKLTSRATFSQQYSPLQQPIYSTTIFFIYNDNGILAGDMKKLLINRAHQNDMMEYIIKKHRWDLLPLTTYSMGYPELSASGIQTILPKKYCTNIA